MRLFLPDFTISYYFYPLFTPPLVSVSSLKEDHVSENWRLIIIEDIIFHGFSSEVYDEWLDYEGSIPSIFLPTLSTSTLPARAVKEHF